MLQSSLMMASEEIPMMDDLKAEKELNVEPDEEFQEQFDQDFWKEVVNFDVTTQNSLIILYNGRSD